MATFFSGQPLYFYGFQCPLSYIHFNIQNLFEVSECCEFCVCVHRHTCTPFILYSELLLHTVSLLTDKLKGFEGWPENTMEAYWLKEKE